MAIKANLVIDQGTDFSAAIELEDQLGQVYDLSGHTIFSQMRKSYASSVAYNFIATHNNTGGKITLSMPSSNTSSIEPGRYLYDVEIQSPDNKINRVVEGIVTVTPNITRV